MAIYLDFRGRLPGNDGRLQSGDVRTRRVARVDDQ